MTVKKVIQNKNVLLAGGDPVEWSLIKNVLESSGANVQQEIKSDKVLEHIMTFAPHVILLDLDIKSESIWNFLIEKRKHSCLENIPVIVLSNQPSRELLQKSFTHGALDVLVKPFEAMGMIKKINKHTQDLPFLSHTFQSEPATLKARVSIPGELIKLSPANLYVEIPAKLAPNQKIEMESNVLNALELSAVRLKTTGHPPTYVTNNTYVCSIKFAGLSNDEANMIREKISKLKAA